MQSTSQKIIDFGKLNGTVAIHDWLPVDITIILHIY